MPPIEDLLPRENAQDGMVFGTNRSRLALAMDQAHLPEDEQVTFSDSQAALSRYRTSAGVDNPFGTGLAAYEPHTAIFDEYANAYGATQQSKADAAAKADTTLQVQAPLGDATGKLGAAINAALNLANRRVPYVWGGTTANGVDCSGLLYYAFKSAGIDTKRYRAVDYGRMGQEVTAQDARPGDIVYFDNPGDVDHVGIYLGNGKMVQAPQSGDVVRVTNVGKATSYRRIFDDGAFTQVATPEGGNYWGYGSANTTWAAVTAQPVPKITRNTRPVSSYGRNF